MSPNPSAAEDPPAPEPRYPYVSVHVSEEEIDDAGALLFELGALGVEQRDATTLARGAGPRTTLVASFEDATEARAAADALPPAWEPRVDEVVGDAWRDEWKKYFEPFRLCPGIVVRPPWRAYESTEKVIVLEPGRAFGTGLHETTQLVAELLSERAGAVGGSPILDVGCGSGVLSLLGLTLGATAARAIDIDPDAVLVTRENAERNGLAHRVDADDAPLAAIHDRYATVVANIEAAPLIELAPALAAAVAPGGFLVLSGILANQWDRVRRAYDALAVEEVRPKGEWVAAVLRP